MGKVDVTEALPKLTADMFPKTEIIPFTIVKVQRVQFDRRTRYVLTSSEHGNKVIWLNTTSLRHVVHELGDDDNGWLNKTVPLVKVKTDNPRNGDVVTSLWVAEPSDRDAWDSVQAAPSARKRGK